MATARARVAAAVLGGRLYVVGGSDGERTLQSGEVYSPRTNRWTPIPDMITPRWPPQHPPAAGPTSRWWWRPAA